MLLRIGLAGLLLVGAFLAYVGFLPAGYEISRSILIDKPAEVIFPLLNGGRAMDSWAPWKDLDPQLKMVFEGAETGVGSVSKWETTGPMGVGSATITESYPPTRVVTKLVYEKPMAMEQFCEFLITSEEAKSKVSWIARGENGFVGRLMYILMGVENMVGRDFEAGLGKLKVLAERSAH